MKLIKQNDSSGGLIFKQNTNGKAMKQNYNFGNCLTNKLSTGSYNLVFQHDLNFYNPLFFVKNSKRTTTTLLPIVTAFSLGTRYMAGLQPPQSEYHIYGNGGAWVYVVEDGQPTYHNREMGLFYFDKSLPSSLFRVDAYRRGYGMLTVPASYPFTVSIGSKISSVIFFNRSISKDEMVYFFNNNLGNDPLNYSGIASQFRWGACVEVIVGGVSYAGFEDDISGLHCYFTNLPAGTIEEKINFVNNNLIDKW